ncbi:hypothetical protein [uncultured Dysosmobacter sp.]|uniref:hypothetical protein n=1 Tax=uncultured Dysosmobacter sp. TaxID=2591384 RepID=UPI002620509D|nr:hypothetical protein [uncultured Dysosmobacter sp.]
MTKGNTSEAILRGDPIEWNGFTLYPITVSKFLEFNDAKEGIVLSQQTLPAKYAGMRYLEALFALDADCMAHGGEKPGLFARAMKFLALALRLPEQMNGQGRAMLPFRIYVDAKDQSRLAAVEVRQGQTMMKMAPKAFDTLRPLLAEMNGLELPNEAHNAELEAAEREIAAANSADLDLNFEDLVYAVAFQSGISETEILDWPVRRFSKMQEAIDRGIGYQLAYLAMASGAKYPKGNPWPSWKFNRKRGLSAALIPMSQYQRQVGGAVETRA